MDKDNHKRQVYLFILKVTEGGEEGWELSLTCDRKKRHGMVQKGAQAAKWDVLSSLTLTDSLVRAAARAAWGHGEGVETKSS